MQTCKPSLNQNIAWLTQDEDGRDVGSQERDGHGEASKTAATQQKLLVGLVPALDGVEYSDSEGGSQHASKHKVIRPLEGAPRAVRPAILLLQHRGEGM